MKKHYSEIAFVLDRSGSMESCREAAIEGFNSFLLDQQKTEGLAKLTLVLFDNEYLVPIDALPVAEILPLNNDSYVPRGATALLDAIGRTVDELGTRLAALPEQDRPGQVIVAILTDGAGEFLPKLHVARNRPCDQTADRAVSVDVPVPGREPGCNRDRGADEYRGRERRALRRRCCRPARFREFALAQGARAAALHDGDSH